MSFAELIKLKEQLGTKVYNDAMFGENSKQKKTKKALKTDFKRENKNRPREATAKKQVPLLGTVKPKKAETDRVRDPRFDSKCGEYDRQKFRQDYGFIADIRENELGELKKQLKDKSLSDEERKKIKLLIQRMNNKLVEERKHIKKIEAAAKDKEEVKVARKEGKTPFYTSKREFLFNIQYYL